MSHPRIEEVSDSDDLASDPGEVDIDDFDEADILRARPTTINPPPAATAAANPPAVLPAGLHPSQTLPTTADRSQYASFQCLYPIYFDANRSRSQGRRVPSSLAVSNPLARDIATACSRLRLPTLLEPDRTHPQDWANPGRVKVGLKKMASSTTNTTVGDSSNIPTNKHHLYILIAKYLKENPTEEDSIGLRVRLGGKLEPEMGKPYPRPAVPRGWKMGDLLPYTSAAMTGGGVSENFFKDMMSQMGGAGAGDPMAALMGSMAGAAGAGGSSGPASGAEDGAGGKKKKDKKKGKA